MGCPLPCGGHCPGAGFSSGNGGLEERGYIFISAPLSGTEGLTECAPGQPGPTLVPALSSMLLPRGEGKGEARASLWGDRAPGEKVARFLSPSLGGREAS